MNIGIDIRLLGRGGHSGIRTYTELLLEHLFTCAPQDQFKLFYNGLHLQPLPSTLTAHSNVHVARSYIPNKILNFSFAAFNRPRLDRVCTNDVFFSPHFDLVATGTMPHVMTFHDLSFMHHPYFFSWKQRAWHWLQRFAFQARRAQHIIAVSEFTKHDLMELLRIPEEKISVVYSGIDPMLHRIDARDPALLAWKKMRGFDFPFILYLGTLEPRKNIPALIRAWELLKRERQFQDLRLVIAGAPGWLYESIIETLHTSAHREHIVLLGPVPTAEKAFLYTQCEAFVYPSFFEGFGLPPLEAQACGAPVVASDRTALPEILGASALLFDPWRVHELAGAIRMCLISTTTHELLRKQGFVNARRFQWKTTAAQTLQILHNATASQ